MPTPSHSFRTCLLPIVRAWRWIACVLAVVGLQSSLCAQVQQKRLLYLGPEAPQLLEISIQAGPFGVEETRQRYARGVLEYLDADGDGTLSPEEAGRIPRDGRLRAGAETLGDDWRELDADGDEVISLEELFRHIDRSMGPAFSIERKPPRLSQTVRLFEDLDIDGDGRISAEEVEQGLAILRYSDFDDDDTLSVTELQPFPLSVVQARQQARTDEAPLPLLALDDDDSLTAAVTRLMDQYGNGGPVPVSAMPGLGEREFLRFDRDRDGRWDEAELRLYLRRAPADHRLSVSLAPPRIDVLTGGADSGMRPVLELGGIPVQFRTESKVWQLRDSVQFYKSRFRVQDQGRKGYLTPAEFAGLETGNVRFEQVDLDGDGQVTLEELDLFFSLDGLAGQSRLVIQLSDEARTLFDILDADGDRRLSPREFLEGPQRLLAYDRNGDGAITPEELASQPRITFTQPELLQTDPGRDMMRPPSRQPVIEQPVSGPLWFQRMDRNRDGEITWREFLGAREQFEELDRDGDGFITLEEALEAEQLRTPGSSKRTD
jgi:Ca2+-binding EF-hand superfamily protein